jgi:ABC-type uncharacterized transport system fused permease/ATPase subunit
MIVTQFKSISSFAAVLARLTSLMDAAEQARDAENRAVRFQKTRGRWFMKR